MLKTIRVAIGVILQDFGKVHGNDALRSVRISAASDTDSSSMYNSMRVLVAKRKADSHQGGKWEFPGGKIKTGESAEQALCRELEEECGIKPVDYSLGLDYSFDYPKDGLRINFFVFLCTKYTGEAFGKEGQITKWESIENLKLLDFPAANAPIVKLILQETDKYVQN
eukprot:Nk52_evm5s167 gene=Nk52_evmTU5s167